MMMSVIGMTGAGGMKLIVWISKILYERPHPRRATYLAQKPYEMATSDDLRDKPIRTVCSYCKRILVTTNEIGQLANLVLQTMIDVGVPIMDHVDAHDIPILGLSGKLGLQKLNNMGHVWLNPAEYASSFLSSDMVLRHGVCEVCYSEIANFFYADRVITKEGV
ncbi:hypothetical protein HDU93_000870 [Gonapodya sp. JEL0774]|nr:hypothetical protein HDU93_000870 [Gonapodya sp. JEL0774]